MRNRRFLLWYCVICLASMIAYLPFMPAYAQPAPAKVIKLNFVTAHPRTSNDVVKFEEPFLDSIEKATKGRVKIERYYSESLIKERDFLSGLKTGVCDIAWLPFHLWPGLTPLFEYLTLPFVGFTGGAQQASGIMWRLYEKFPEIRKELEAIGQPLSFYSVGPYHLLTTKKEVKTLEDIKGLKLRAGGGPPSDATKLLGAVPVGLAMPETYLAMQKGILDGMGASYAVILMFHHWDVAKYLTVVPMYSLNTSIIMGRNRWNSLPRDIQEQIMSVSGVEASMRYGYICDSVRDVMYDQAKKDGKELIEYVLPPGEYAKWAAACKPVSDAWMEKMVSQGYSRAKVQEIVGTVKELINAYKPLYQ
jgi:TRAP-type C4-dicarboxylate transport system substrate-binding protein